MIVIIVAILPEIIIIVAISLEIIIIVVISVEIIIIVIISLEIIIIDSRGSESWETLAGSEETLSVDQSPGKLSGGSPGDIQGIRPSSRENLGRLSGVSHGTRETLSRDQDVHE